MIRCEDIAVRIAAEFFVPLTAMRLARGGETINRAREAYALAVQCLTSAPDVSAARALGVPVHLISHLRQSGHKSVAANPIFGARVEEIVRAMLRQDEAAERDHVGKMVGASRLGQMIDKRAEEAEAEFEAAALSDGPMREQLELETLIAIDPDAACYAASARGLRALAESLPPEDKGKAQDYRRMATRLEMLAEWIS